MEVSDEPDEHSGRKSFFDIQISINDDRSDHNSLFRSLR